MFFCCECCVLSGRGLCYEPITRPEESYRLWCVVVRDLESSRMRRPWPALGKKKKKMACVAIRFVGIRFFYEDWRWILMNVIITLFNFHRSYQCSGNTRSRLLPHSYLTLAAWLPVWRVFRVFSFFSGTFPQAFIFKHNAVLQFRIVTCSQLLITRPPLPFVFK
jgi:hypothetical protein